MTTTRKKGRLPICSRGQAGLLVVGFLAFLFLGVGGVNAQVNVAEYQNVILSTTGLLYYRPMQESAGTTLTAAIGGVNINLSGGATVGVSGKVGYAVAFDGIDDYGVTDSSLDLSSYHKIIVEGLVLGQSHDIANVFWEHTDNADAATGGFFFTAQNRIPVGKYWKVQLKGDMGTKGKHYANGYTDTWHHVVAIYDKSQPADNEVNLYVDGILQINTGIEGSVTADNTNNFANDLFYIMVRGVYNSQELSFFNSGFMQHLAIYTDLSDQNIATHATLALNGPIYAPHIVSDTDLWDNGYNTTTDVPLQSNYARFVFTTDADTIMVVGNATRNIPLGIRVDGIDRPVLDFAGTLGEKQFTVNLGSFGVEKTVEIIAGRQEGAGGQSNVKGSYIASVKYPMGSSFTVQSPTQNNKRIVVYGDSISVGDGTTQSVYDSLIPLLRNKYGFDVMSEGYQARTFKYDVGDSTKLNNFVNRLTSYNPTIIYLQIGTNDFGLNQRNASDFGAAYTTFINSLHDSLPDVRIICQTPFDRNNKNTSNSFGNILDDYRNQIITACSNVSWATIIDGATTVSLSDMPDGLHPNTTGHAKYANAVVPYLLNPAYSITGQTTIETSATSAPFTLSLNTNSGYELPIFDGSGAIAISVSSGILSVISDGIISGNNSSSVVVIPNDTSTGFSFTYTSMGLSGEVMLTFSNNKDWIDPSSMILSIGKSLSPTPETPSTPSPSSSGGGGGGTSLKADSCSAGDLSASYYDGTCGTTADLAPLVAAKVNLLRPLIRLIYIKATEKEKTLVHDIITSCSQTNKKEIIKLACQELVANWDF